MIQYPEFAFKKMAHLIADYFRLPFLDLHEIDPYTLPLQLLTETLIREFNILPLFIRNQSLHLAVADPSQPHVLQEVQFHTGLSCQAVIVEHPKLRAMINQLLNETEIKSLAHEIQAQHHVPNTLPEHAFTTEHQTTQDTYNDAPMVKYVNKIINNAIQQGASDIHFEPYEQQYRIRYRLDGLLSLAATPSPTLASRMTARIKVMFNLNISERRIPQDGHCTINHLSAHPIDLRISTCPTINGEKIVIRILNAKTLAQNLEHLGLNPLQKKQLLTTIQQPQGMIVVTGPTGSGKTLTLYAALNHLNTPEHNISTIEDPVEINIHGINQVQINPKVGLTFSNTLRAFLRQDPDIIMVGEIRDYETAEIAIKAAQTGHLVLSSLHTNSAVDTLVRLLNMGIPNYNLISAIRLIVAQRLVRKLCEHCKIVRDDLSEARLLELGLQPDLLTKKPLYKAQGCRQCNQGYRGQVGLFEVLPLTASLAKLTLAQSDAGTILQHAKQEGMLTIYQSGLEKIQDGITTIEELLRITVESTYA